MAVSARGRRGNPRGRGCCSSQDEDRRRCCRRNVGVCEVVGELAAQMLDLTAVGGFVDNHEAQVVLSQAVDDALALRCNRSIELGMSRSASTEGRCRPFRSDLMLSVECARLEAWVRHQRAPHPHLQVLSPTTTGFRQVCECWQVGSLADLGAGRRWGENDSTRAVGPGSTRRIHVGERVLVNLRDRRRPGAGARECEGACDDQNGAQQPCTTISRHRRISHSAFHAVGAGDGECQGGDVIVEGTESMPSP